MPAKKKDPAENYPKVRFEAPRFKIFFSDEPPNPINEIVYLKSIDILHVGLDHEGGRLIVNVSDGKGMSLGGIINPSDLFEKIRELLDIEAIKRYGPNPEPSINTVVKEIKNGKPKFKVKRTYDPYPGN